LFQSLGTERNTVGYATAKALGSSFLF